ncbi:hypothetical protein [Planctobacterium marinum]|uniref:Solute-binding protein family 3/N-terminal domain-containing protein n=1 Tax=Planctobacterium marinum TaxID=1631968 RepID=A0AA48HTN3_9ALTE|nr:hypothetical protein MACH26_11590 [Planctobacterium marinum]
MKLLQIAYFVLFLWALVPICRANVPFTVATIDWCPYICDINSDRPGVLVEIVREVYKNTEFEPEFLVLPWSRAIREVESGKHMALLAPAKSEAPNLLYPKHPIGTQRFCFFSRQEDNWQYRLPEDIAQRKVVYPVDGLPLELRYLQSETNQLQGLSFQDSFEGQTSELLLQGYIDSILITESSMLYFQYEHKHQNKIRTSGCLAEDELYLAFTPSGLHTGEVKLWQDIHDNAAVSPEHQKQVAIILARYGL